jgi:hypothetical protein
MKSDKMKTDSPIVAEVRQRRSEISKRFGDDVHKLFRHLCQRQSRYSNRLVGQVTVVPAGQHSK